ncbi:cytochrome b561, DM13 and DOMON domain-containing protein At5g54830 [Apium graveolens]|uniref:Cytochrome b561 domain-containing protein n=1 Tax=Apium graveolens TaxID=4045 RepID=A0A6L5BBN8_APIGR|nr:hypothetical protein AG4045_005641 [Apium graveolens]
MTRSSLFLLLCCCWVFIVKSDPGSSCSKSNTSLINYETQFSMIQHQVRGVFTVLDDCSFRVSEFDMLKGSDVHWWGSTGVDFLNMTKGFVLSDHKLDMSFSNDSFVVNLRKNVSWDLVRVVSIWDVPTASDFGHVVLGNLGDGLEPVPNNGSGNGSSGGVGNEPTMFQNCKQLSSNFRVRWTLRAEDNLIDIGLEAGTAIQDYMAFGWAKPESSNPMLGGDVVVTGFTDEGLAFADDYYITRYSQCMMTTNGFEGVCPDSFYEPAESDALVNNTKLIYAHRKDGVSFVRYQRMLNSVDRKYDVQVNYTGNMTVIWALGSMKPPDSIRPYYLPTKHGESYGYLKINVSERINDCLGPLDAEDKEDQDLLIADGKEALVITTGPALHYPNPPNPSKVIYINRKEAPVLRVERGVPIKFSIQAGHNVAFYVTSDPLGGNATLRNLTETIYFGGPKAEGVQSSPTELTWAPNRNTPDDVYYQNLYTQKMGWKVQVVDGGLPDMYNNSVVLDDQQVTLFWTLSTSSISVAARGEKKSGYLAIGFGSEMVNSYAYVGWMDSNGTGRVSTYWIDGRDPSNIHPTNENLTYVRCKSENGVITLEFTRPLNPSCDRDEKPECNNIIDPTTPLKVIWAMGAQWSGKHLSERNMHSITSSRPVRVLLVSGSAEAEEDLRPVLAVHGFMMFLAWGILLPGGILSARYLKHLKGDGWFKIHVYMQYSGLSIIFLGFLFAVAELRGLYLDSLHVKFGMGAIILACVQPVNAYLRPKKSASGEIVSSNRILWEYIHVIVGRCSIVVGMAALFSGMKHLGERYDGENVQGVTWALIIWFLIGTFTIVYLEYREKQRRRENFLARSNWVLGNGEEEDHDLLSPSGMSVDKDLHSSDRMEVQLEPLNR